MSFFLNPSLACDYYKVGHPFMQPKGMNTVYTTWTARNAKHHLGCPKTVVFGQQYTIERWFLDFFNDNFFDRSLEELENEYEEVISNSFNPIYADFSKFAELHELGYLPIAIWGVPEGTLLPTGIPDHVIFNTEAKFAWLPQYLEDLWSANNWMPSTSATTAFYRRELLRPYIVETCDSIDVLPHMCGDFSLRGHTSMESGLLSGAAHLVAFDRTATIGSNSLLEKYYDANLIEPETVPGLGTPSLEHSVVEQGIAVFKHRIVTGDVPTYCQSALAAAMSENWEINLLAEMCFILYLLNEVQPKGVITYVADTYDYWGVVSKILPIIKPTIMQREGCFSVRPDSGDPVKIICGDPEAPKDSPEYLGTIVNLLRTFGYQDNSKKCKVLPPQIRMIYGDAITPMITKQVGDWCIKNRVAMNNLCFGIGAYTYQYATRDTRGYAIKATDCIHSEYGEMPLYKEPKTDPGKKSVRGCVAVIKDSRGIYSCVQGLSLKESLTYPGNIMVEKFRNGEMNPAARQTIYQIRERLNKEGNMDRYNATVEEVFSEED